jgi:integrase
MLPTTTEAETIGEKNKTWRKSTIPGLYLHGPSGTYYSRYRLGENKRVFRSLETKVFTVARLKMSDRMREVQKLRTANAPVENEARTLGDLATIAAAELETDKQRANHQFKVRRLRACWPGTFDATPPSNVSLETILKLRERLRHREFKVVNTKRVRKGYRPGTVNQTLSCLNALLQMARGRHLLVDDPFSEPEKIFLPSDTRRPSLPRRVDMDRIFEELSTPQTTAQQNWQKRLNSIAQDVADHARSLAYSGMRKEEAWAAQWSDDQGDRFFVRGTKSKTSERFIPVTDAFRHLLTELRARRQAAGLPTVGRILRVRSSLAALQRACARLGLPKITHHDLRHYFATICIESGVDIPTVSKWLGHSDGGALAMKTYGHLRDEHSVHVVKRVSFAPQTPQSTSG